MAWEEEEKRRKGKEKGGIEGGKEGGGERGREGGRATKRVRSVSSKIYQPGGPYLRIASSSLSSPPSSPSIHPSASVLPVWAHADSSPPFHAPPCRGA